MKVTISWYGKGPDANWLTGYLFESGFYKFWPDADKVNDPNAIKETLRTTKDPTTRNISLTLTVPQQDNQRSTLAFSALTLIDMIMSRIWQEFHVQLRSSFDDQEFNCFSSWLNRSRGSLEGTRAQIAEAVNELKKARSLPGLGRKEIAKVRMRLEDELVSLDRALDQFSRMKYRWEK